MFTIHFSKANSNRIVLMFKFFKSHDSILKQTKEKKIATSMIAV